MCACVCVRGCVCLAAHVFLLVCVCVYAYPCAMSTCDEIAADICCFINACPGVCVCIHMHIDFQIHKRAHNRSIRFHKNISKFLAHV